MARKALTRPTDTEIEIMRVIWDRGPSSVADVHEELHKRRETGYTTVLKQMQIMHDKGLLERDDSSRQHVYRVKQSKAVVQKKLVTDLVDRVFAGSSQLLVMQALSTRPASADEIQEIRNLLDKMEGDRK